MTLEFLRSVFGGIYGRRISNSYNKMGPLSISIQASLNNILLTS